MRRILETVLGLVLAVSVQAASKLRAGAAAVDVSPREFPINMVGGFTANMADGVHDPLHARAIVLDDGATTLAVVVVDSLGVARETCDEAKAIAAQRCGIKPEKVLICGTHTHSAPSSNSTNTPQAAAYRKLLVHGIAESIVRAHAALQPVSVGVGVHPLPEEVFNRRWFLKPGKMPLNPFGKLDQVKTNPGTSPDVLDRPAGPTDPDITVLSVRDAKGRNPLAVLANYALHYVGGRPPGKVSADYFGEFARLMSSRVHGDKDFVAIMSNGASGDINNIPFLVTRPPREPFEQIRIVASKAADAAWFALRKIERHDPDVRLGMIEREIPIRYRRPTPEQLAWAKSVLAMRKEERQKLPNRAENYAHSTIAAGERAEDILPVQLQAIRIGDFAICAIPFEVFCEIGLDLKKRSPFPRTMIISIANAKHGYLPTPEQHKLGGYETWLGTCKVQEDASVIITNELLDMLRELAKP